MPPPDKVALVTGAGTGIGRAAALALARTGHAVVLAGRRKALLQETAEMAGPDGPAMLAVTCDLAEPEQIRALFARTEEAFGRLDLLFNNAGVSPRGVPFEDLPLGDWQRAVDVNLTAAFLCAQEAFRIMKRQTPRGGRIVNNGSVAAYAPRPRSVAYSATKHAITGLTRSLALDGREHDIACSQIDVGNAETPMTERMKAGIPQPDGRVVAEPVFDVAHVGDAVARIAGMPLDANVLFMTIMATKMPFVGRG
ncbi:MAG: SDR family oxidoreductase [Defluviicoccus sp.]|nr:SDR family oxidoreductase [Defluviicoccus sp.]MDE0278362.1 SDR family oxidoreductase [Defluviicoccus sp.]